MSRRWTLRIISIVMFIVGFVFFWIAIHCPTLGVDIYIGSYEVTVEQVRLFYKLYIVVMIVLFVVSYIVKDRKKEK